VRKRDKFFANFTPVVKFDLSFDKKWSQILDIKLKKITDNELFNYFRLREREFNHEGHAVLLRRTEPIGLDLVAIKESVYLGVHEAKFAFVSDLPRTKHLSQVKQVLAASKLLKYNGILCPITFDPSGRILSFIHPLETKVPSITSLSKPELNDLKSLTSLIPKIKPDDLVLLNQMAELGVSPLSLLLAVILVERTLMRGDRSEIGFKVRLYCANLLAKYYNYDEDSVFNSVRKAYEERSAFVHDRPKTKNSSIKSLFYDVYDYAVKLLRLSVEYPNVMEHENLQKLILSDH